ncbi:hypothetical protein A0H76_1861 [Hepatospora eriocheir]|uniref:Uncharacterized protein n=1 Tax=Hepatospora eriocheir TaxID=1081669 RepID=A0A1X0QGC5_9MICR|nr:hypothetical protein A0H76_1861 [Hepatospora eriocheir]
MFNKEIISLIEKEDIYSLFCTKTASYGNILDNLNNIEDPMILHEKIKEYFINIMQQTRETSAYHVESKRILLSVDNFLYSNGIISQLLEYSDIIKKEVNYVPPEINPSNPDGLTGEKLDEDYLKFNDNQNNFIGLNEFSFMNQRPNAIDENITFNEGHLNMNEGIINYNETLPCHKGPFVDMILDSNSSVFKSDSTPLIDIYLESLKRFSIDIKIESLHRHIKYLETSEEPPKE